MLTLDTAISSEPAKTTKEVSSESFEHDVIRASMEKPVVVDFWAPWCGPCRQMMPLLEKTIQTTAGKVILVTVNIDQNPELAQIFRIQSVPTVYAFFQGQPVDGFMGARGESDLKKFIDKLKQLAGKSAPPGAPDTAAAKREIEAADSLFRQREFQTAQDKYALALEYDPQCTAGLAGIAWCLLAAGHIQEVQELLTDLTPEQKEEQRIKGLLFILNFPAPVNFDTTSAGSNLLKNPQDYETQYRLASYYLAQANFQASIDCLLEIIKKNKDWDNQKARHLLLQIFDALGPHHPCTLSGRRRLSGLLFS